MTRNIYYVYIHRRCDTDEVFYVGKGKNNRAYDVKGRNDYWQRVYKKHGRTVEFIKTKISNEEALDLEKETIKLYIENGYRLTNLTPGGECGGNIIDYTRHDFYSVKDDKFFTCAQYELREMYNISQQDSSKICAGQYIKQLVLAKNIDKYKRKIFEEVFCFVNTDTFELVICSIKELRKRYNLPYSASVLLKKTHYFYSFYGFILMDNFYNYLSRPFRNNKEWYV